MIEYIPGKYAHRSVNAEREIFLKDGFESVDEVKPDFELSALKFDKNAENPSFKKIDAKHVIFQWIFDIDSLRTGVLYFIQPLDNSSGLILRKRYQNS
jgi:hypothetical protein